jgi:hypothetical protein
VLNLYCKFFDLDESPIAILIKASNDLPVFIGKNVATEFGLKTHFAPR